MATNTPNYNLSVPENTDTMEDTVQAYRDNLVIIDNNLGGGGGGGNADVVHLTQEEYDALPASKTSDHKIYMIEDTFSEGELGRINVNGAFIDTTNVITTAQFMDTMSYTATEDCFVSLYLVTGRGDIFCKIDGSNVWLLNDGQIAGQGNIIPLKKGQTLTITNASTTYSSLYIVYGIQPASNVVVIPDYLSSCYSTSERQIGCYRDGKPLYQKTFEFSSPVTVSYNSWTNTDISISGNNIDKIISAVGYNANEKAHWNVDTSLEVSSYVSLLTGRNGDTISVKYLTLQYTKTTDTAGSGEWTPHGTPTVHYSTEETCIGTWITGKPLYQKTISKNNVNMGNANGVYTSIPHDIANLDFCVDLEMICPKLNISAKDQLREFANFKVDATNVFCAWGNNYYSAAADRYWYITMRYTKTTD